jgi:hypothetical protein
LASSDAKAHRENEGACSPLPRAGRERANIAGKLMTNKKRKKQKSSGWLPSEKRETAEENQARKVAADRAWLRRDGTRRRRWRNCPVRLCRRTRCCSGDPERCYEQPKAKAPDHRNEAKRVQTNVAPASPNSLVAHGAPATPAVAAPMTVPQPAPLPGGVVLPAMSAAEAAAAIAASIANCTDPSFVGADELDAILRHGTSGYPQRR